jgi:hypothetical protein
MLHSPRIVRSIKQRWIFVLLLMLAGCGGGSNSSYTPPALPKPSMSVVPAAALVPLGTSQHFYATVTNTANNGVTWTASAGTIDQSGNYVGPASLPSGGTATVTATLSGTPMLSASAIVSVSSQPVTLTISPAATTVKAGFSTAYTVTVSGTSNQIVTWTVNDLPGDFSFPGLMSGNQYTAPTPMVVATTYSVVASSDADPSKTASASVTAIPLENQEAQTFPMKLGTSGVNGTTPDCCSGTLGSLLVDRKGKQYILSNNHVMGRLGHAAVGEPIVQPGMIEALCDPAIPKKVASFTAAPAITSNADAAIAEVLPGAVDPTGAIIGLGGIAADGSYIPAPPSRTIAVPSVGMAVAKSGRTTGLSCGVVEAINGSILIDIPAECGNPSTAKILFENQVILTSMVRPGDSGSLIVDAATSRPLALVAGLASDYSFASANPAGLVIKALNAATKSILSFVGGGDHVVSCTPSASHISQNAREAGQGLPASQGAANVTPLVHEVVRAMDVQSRHEHEFFALSGVVGVAVGRQKDNPGRAALEVFVDHEAMRPSLPAEVEGVPVRVVPTGRFGPGTLGTTRHACGAGREGSLVVSRWQTSVLRSGFQVSNGKSF